MNDFVPACGLYGVLVEYVPDADGHYVELNSVSSGPVVGWRAGSTAAGVERYYPYVLVTHSQHGAFKRPSAGTVAPSGYGAQIASDRDGWHWFFAPTVVGALEEAEVRHGVLQREHRQWLADHANPYVAKQTDPFAGRPLSRKEDQ